MRLPEPPQQYEPGYIRSLIREIEREMEKGRPVQKGWSVTGSFTEKRDLNGASGSTTDVRETLATLLKDLLSKGVLLP